MYLRYTNFYCNILWFVLATWMYSFIESWISLCSMACFILIPNKDQSYFKTFLDFYCNAAKMKKQSCALVIVLCKLLTKETRGNFSLEQWHWNISLTILRIQIFLHNIIVFMFPKMIYDYVEYFPCFLICDIKWISS